MRATPAPYSTFSCYQFYREIFKRMCMEKMEQRDDMMLANIIKLEMERDTGMQNMTMKGSWCNEK